MLTRNKHYQLFSPRMYSGTPDTFGMYENPTIQLNYHMAYVKETLSKIMFKYFHI